MTSEVKKPPDGGGGEVTDPLSLAEAIDEGKGSTEKNNDGTVTGEESLGSHISVDDEKPESSEGSATGEKSPGSYASAAASAMTDPWGLDGKLCAMRKYDKIIEACKEECKNVLNVKIEKIRNKEEQMQNLNQIDVENILFDELKIDIDAVEEVDVSSRYNFKEIIFKKGHDLTRYNRAPFVYKGHLVTAGSRSSVRNKVKVTFRNVPRSVPDEELLNFCFRFGGIEDRIVYYGKYSSGNFKGLYNGTRWLNMELKSRVPINFIWLEGPEDIESTRVTVTWGAGGETQCGHCLRTGTEGCPGLGKAKICRAKMVKRAQIGEYMKTLEEKYQYKTLKAKYLDSLKEKKEDNETEVDDVKEDAPEDNEVEVEEEEGATEKEEQDLDKENQKLRKELQTLNEKIAIQEKREITLNSLRKIILKNLEESLAEPLFAESNMSALVSQFSLSLKDDEFSTNDQGLIILNNDLIFKGIKLSSDDEKENEIIRSNFAAFTKAVTQHTSVKISNTGVRRLSINKRPRNPSDDNSGMEAKKSNSSPKPTGIPSGQKFSRRNSQKTHSITTHHQTK